MRTGSLRRRDVLWSFLGLSAAQAAAGCRAPPPQVPGGLVDDDVLAGHRLREAPPPLAVPSRRVDVAIVGAGVAGLSAGWRLAAAGVRDVAVLEVARVEGGTARSGENSVSAFPWGAHYLPAPLTARGPVPRLLREAGVLLDVDESGAPVFDEAALIQEPEERLFYRGAWYEGLYLRAGASEEDLAELKRFEALMDGFAAARDGKGRKAFDVPLGLGSDDAEWTALDRLSMAEWMRLTGFTSPRLLAVVDYACRDDYGATPASTSAWAGIWYFAARQTGGTEHDGFLSWPQGNAFLVNHLHQSLAPSRAALGHLVHTVREGSDGWEVHGVEAGGGAPVALSARHVILATPRHVAARLVAPWRTAPPEYLGAFESSPWVVANLTLSAPPRSRGFPLAWDNVLHGSASLGYVVATHQRLRASPVGPTVLTWYYPLAGPDVKAERRRLLDTTFEDWRDIALADLGPAHRDFARCVERVDVMRWGHAMVRASPGFLWGEHRRKAAESLGGRLHFAHADLSGLPLFEEANWHGVRAAEAALAELKPGQASWLG